MALKDLKSRFDRHTWQEAATPPAPLSGETVAGPAGEGPDPAAGAYFSNNKASDSPFDTIRAGKMDQLVNLLENTVTSANHNYGSITYQPSPHNVGGYQDMNGATTDHGSGFTNPLTGNYDGQYTHPDTGATF